jgi:zinc transport system substrate-binding protein
MAHGEGYSVHHYRPTVVVALMTALLATHARAAPEVLATIKPVHSLAAAVMADVGAPGLLIEGAQSEHAYALKPSDAEKIARARIVFEIGPDLETYLIKPLAALAPGAKVIALESAPGVAQLAARRGGLWGEGEPGEGPSDPHIWLDPENAVAMTRAIAQTLIEADPAHARAYRANRDREIAALKTLENDLRRRLAPLRARPYLVFHDAYRYFEARFGLNAIGAVTVAPERPVGPRRIANLRATILDGRAVCVFREPQFSPRLIDSLVEGSRARIGVLDPLGAELEPGARLYPRLLDGLAASLESCLGGDKNR